ncbi:MAG: aminotransferase class I/II-fold pyridoxal phosphate-dependent enzyme [Lachnospiraceae bacterium]
MGENTGSLYEKLKELAMSDEYPMHMPGHKRLPIIDMSEDVDFLEHIAKIDITEIEGFDNLHHPTDLLKSIQEETAGVYGARKSFYLVGGSTTGILTAISATVPEKGTILIARNSHKSVYHAAFLRDLDVAYLYPCVDEIYGIPLPISPDMVETALEQNPNIQAVLITSPTYEGLISDIKGIADVVHARNIPLIVDEAHGAHLAFTMEKRYNTNLYADLVIQSLHKTTRAMTQTALLHLNGHRVMERVVQRYLDIYMTSSPSYVLLASMQEAVRDWSCYQSLYKKRMQEFTALFKEAQSTWKHLQIFSFYEKYHNVYSMDACKLAICVKHPVVDGMFLFKKLQEEFHITLEMSQGSYALAILTPYDTIEGVKRMLEALGRIDEMIVEITETLSNRCLKDLEKAHSIINELTLFLPEKSGKISEFWRDGQWTCLDDSIGKICAEFVYLYPPGVPIMVPGEIWTQKYVNFIKNLHEMAYEVLGTEQICVKIYTITV